MKSFVCRRFKIPEGVLRTPELTAALAAALALFLSPTVGARAQTPQTLFTQTPPTQRTPPRASRPTPPTRPGPAIAPAQAPPAAAVTSPAATPGVQSQPPRGATAPRAPIAPRNVVTVVHRLDGWRLLRWMAAKGGDEWLVEELPSPAEFHTNIVAGFVSDDGRTVVARLPRGDVEAEDSLMPPNFSSFYAGSPPRGFEPQGFTLIRGDGRRVKAKFVGLDASTGISLLEAAEPLFIPGALPGVETPAVGQRVRLYAPARASAPAGMLTPPPAAAPAPPAPSGLVGDTGVVYFSVGETDGRLTSVKHSAAGTPVQATVRAGRMTPAWAGAIATTERGGLIGIVGDSGDTEMQLVPAESIRLARERVLARRASVPQPWLGARGDAVSKLSLEKFFAKGWPREWALPLLSKPRGVLLTSVAEGAPAALAGLRPGDVISRVGGREVRGVEDFSHMLREAGAGAKLDLTVLRALEAAPLKMAVELSGTNDPAVAMEAAEALLQNTTPQARATNSLAAFGLSTVGLTARSAARLGADGGQFVVNVREGSAAAKAGLRPGDVIETVNGEQLTRNQWRRLWEGEPSELSVGVVRGGQRLSVKLPRGGGPKKE